MIDVNAKITFQPDDIGEFSKCLDSVNVDYLQPKSSELTAVIVALGGGAGIAAMLNGLAIAVKNYFDGRSKNMKRLIVSCSGKKIELTADNSDTFLAIVKQLCEK